MKKYLSLMMLSLLLTSCSKNVSVSSLQASKVEGYSLGLESSKQLINTDPFGTSMTLMYYFKNDKDKTNNLSNVVSLFDNTCSSLHKQFDRHYYYDDENGELINNVKVINDSFGSGNKIKCNDELYNLLKFAVSATKLTHSNFNVFTGRVTDFWEECFARAYNLDNLDQFDPAYNTSYKTKLENYVKEIPLTDEDIDEQLVFFDDTKEVLFNKLENQTSLYHPLISVGGIAKGMGTDYIKQVLKDNGYNNAIINSGSSSISIISKPTFIVLPKEGVTISTKNPNVNGYFTKLIAQTFKIKDEINFGTSSKASYQKYYTVYIDEKAVCRYHIFNPSTGYSEQYHTQISIISKTFSNAYLDCFTTAFMNLSVDDGMILRDEILNKFDGYDMSIYWLDYDENSNGIIYASDHNYEFTLGENVNVIYK